MASTSLSTSPSLLDALRADEPGAWERLVELYAPLVHAWCRRSRMGEEDVADVFQEVFRTVAGKLDQFELRGPSDSFRAWLRAITRSRVVDHARRAEREPVARGGSTMQDRWNNLPSPADENVGAAVDEAAGEGGEAGDPALRALLRRVIERVRPQVHASTWSAFWATAVEGRPCADVADELAMSPGAVRVAKCRVLQRLRAELGDLPRSA